MKSYTTLKVKKSLRQCTIDKHRACGTTRAAVPRKKSPKPYKPKYAYESIFTSDLKRCFMTGCTEGWFGNKYYYIHVHHIFGASNKANSEKYHFLIPLRDDYHDMSDYGVHFDREFDLKLKRICQTYWLLCYGSKEEFIEVFGKWW